MRLTRFVILTLIVGSLLPTLQALGDPVPQESSHPPPRWQAAARLGAVYTSPSGDYYEASSGGIGFGASFYIALSQPLSIRFDFEKSGLSDKGLRQVIILDTNFALVDSRFDLNGYRFSLGLQYTQSPDRRAGGVTFWHFHGGVGLVNHRLATNIVLNQIRPGILFTLSGTDSETKYLVTCGVGATTLFSKHFGIDYEFLIDAVFAGNNLTESPISPYPDPGVAYVYNLRLGLIAFF